MQTFCRRHNYVQVNPAGPVPQFPGWPALQALRQPPALNDYQQLFLQKQIPEKADKPSPISEVHQSGKKYLGEGATAVVGMWEYDGPQPRVFPPRRVVVKELFPNRSAYDLKPEVEHLRALSLSFLITLCL
jgi:hypothetical protein